LVFSPAVVAPKRDLLAAGIMYFVYRLIIHDVYRTLRRKDEEISFADTAADAIHARGDPVRNANSETVPSGPRLYMYCVPRQ